MNNKHTWWTTCSGPHAGSGGAAGHRFDPGSDGTSCSYLLTDNDRFGLKQANVSVRLLIKLNCNIRPLTNLSITSNAGEYITSNSL